MRIVTAFLVPTFHVFHVIFRLMIANAFPGCRFDRLKVVHTELKLKVSDRTLFSRLGLRRALTSFPFTIRESGSAFISQYFGDIVRSLRQPSSSEEGPIGSVLFNFCSLLGREIRRIWTAIVGSLCSVLFARQFITNWGFLNITIS